MTRSSVLHRQVIAEKRHIYKGVSANVDFYSGFVYEMLGIPVELFTPIFAVARIAGWSAHRIEEITNAGKIIRPAYKSVGELRRICADERKITAQQADERKTQTHYTKGL